MPLYEYQCDACNTRFELLQRIDASPPEVCERCGAPSPRRLISSPAFQFKGAGWYVTDYARAGSGGSAKGDDGGGGEAKGDASSEGKAETKADTASAAATSPSTSGGSGPSSAGSSGSPGSSSGSNG